MSRTRILMIAGAAAVAVMIGLLFQGGGSDDPQQLPPQPVDDGGPPAPEAIPEAGLPWIMVASKDLPAGHELGQGDLGWQAWAEDFEDGEDYVILEEDPEALTKYGGYVVQIPVPFGRPVTLNNMVDPGASGFMAALLSPGMRAASVAIEQVRAAGGFVAPNDRVDVLLLQNERSAGGRGREVAVARVVLENIRVLAIDGQINQKALGKQQQRRDSVRYRQATLEVIPRDSQILAVASSLGTVHLVLRGVADVGGYSGATRDGMSLLPGRNTVPLYSVGSQTDLQPGGR